MYNLLTYYLDDIIIVTRYSSRQFNFSVHVKINHIEFEDTFLIKTHENVKRLSVRRLLKEFSNKQ